MENQAENIYYLPSPDSRTSHIETENVPIAEMTIDELYSLTDETNPQTGGRMTRLDILRREEEERHGGRVFTQMGKDLSKDAKKFNALSSRGKLGLTASGALFIAVIAMRQVKRHYNHKSD